MTQRKFLGNATFAGDVDFTGTVTGVGASGGGVEIGDIILTHPNEVIRMGYLNVTEDNIIAKTGDTAEMPQASRTLLAAKYPSSMEISAQTNVSDFSELGVAGLTTSLPVYNILSDGEGGFLCANSNRQLYRSTDGQNWTYITQGSANLGGSSAIHGDKFIMPHNGPSYSYFGGTAGLSGGINSFSNYQYLRILYYDDEYAIGTSRTGSTHNVCVFKLGTHDLPNSALEISTTTITGGTNQLTGVTRGDDGRFVLVFSHLLYTTLTPEISGSYVGEKNVSTSSQRVAHFNGKYYAFRPNTGTNTALWESDDPTDANSWVSQTLSQSTASQTLYSHFITTVSDGFIYFTNDRRMCHINPVTRDVTYLDLSPLTQSPNGSYLGTIETMTYDGKSIYIGGYKQADNGAVTPFIAKITNKTHDFDTEFFIKGVGLIDGLRPLMKVV